MNKSEALVAELCRKSFLSLWSYPNPRGKGGGKELCDVLVVCDPDVIIFSVKEIEFKEEGDAVINGKRWHKRAIEASAKQIYGAERWIADAHTIVTCDGTGAIPFPPKDVRRVHRVAVALGSKDRIPLYYGDFDGGGFVHVLRERSLMALLGELDTISDFVAYLQDKERYLKAVRCVITEGEENLLAYYIHNKRSFPANMDMLILEGDLWARLQVHEQFKAKKRADEVSRFWDGLIEEFCSAVGYKADLVDNTLTNTERATRIMARETRFSRRVLAKCFLDFLNSAAQGRTKSRMFRAPSGVVYVFLALPHDVERKSRMAELGARCFIARGMHHDANTVVGISTEVPAPGSGSSFDGFCLLIDEWTAEHEREMKKLQADCGFFTQAIKKRGTETEYPT